MTSLSSAELLGLWELSRDLVPVERALALWAAASPDRTVAELAAAPVGRRDGALIALRRALYGDRADCFLECPRCALALEFTVDLAAVPGPPADDAGEPAGVTWEAWTCRYRLPTTEDLRALAGVASFEDVSAALLARCVLDLRRAGDPVPVAKLPPGLRSALDAEMGRRDPQADVELSLSCPGCSFAWVSSFDVAAFLWRELDRDARRLLREVDLLARAYGWTEGEILGLPRARRRSYLELLGAA